MARYAYNPFTGNLDRIGSSGGGGAVTEVTATNAGSSVSFDTVGTIANLEVTDVNFNTFIGENSGNALLTGTNNSSLGYNTLPNLTSGSNNLALGINSGNSYSDESGNILLDNNGVIGDNGVIRIGTSQTLAFIAGIANNDLVLGYQAIAINPITNQVGYTSFTDSVANTFIGKFAGNTTLSGLANTGFGQSALPALTTGLQNSGFGSGSLLALESGNFNSALGYFSGALLVSGVNNTIIGYGSLGNLVSGNNNVALGFNSGLNYTTNESGNLLLGNPGVVGDNNTTRIGNGQTTAFIDGVSGVTVSNMQSVTIDTVTGQLGSADINGFITITGTLTSTQIKSLRASPVVIVPAQGAGTMIRLISFTSKLNYAGSNVFAGTSSIVIFPESNLTNSLATLATNTIVNASSTQYFLGSPTALSGLSTIFENLGIQISVNSATEFTGNASNDNTFTYSITYQVVSI